MAENGFFTELNESQLGQLLEFGSKVGGTFTAVTGFISLFQESDAEKILEAIEALREEMNRNFRELSLFIAQQTRIIVEEVRLTEMAAALAHSDTGFFQLQRYLGTTGEIAQNALRDAENESILGVEFFTNLGATPDPYFLPGLIKAGSIRLLVVAAEPPEFRSNDAIVAQVGEMVINLGSMIESIKLQVNQSHRITRITHTERCPLKDPQ